LKTKETQGDKGRVSIETCQGALKHNKGKVWGLKGSPTEKEGNGLAGCTGWRETPNSPLKDREELKRKVRKEVNRKKRVREKGMKGT